MGLRMGHAKVTDKPIPADVIERILPAFKDQRDCGDSNFALIKLVLRAAGWPEMVEALKEIAKQIPSTEIETNDADFEGAYDECIFVARTALAKAKGEG